MVLRPSSLTHNRECCFIRLTWLTSDFHIEHRNINIARGVTNIFDVCPSRDATHHGCQGRVTNTVALATAWYLNLSTSAASNDHDKPSKATTHQIELGSPKYLQNILLENVMTPTV